MNPHLLLQQQISDYKSAPVTIEARLRRQMKARTRVALASHPFQRMRLNFSTTGPLSLTVADSCSRPKLRKDADGTRQRDTRELRET